MATTKADAAQETISAAETTDLSRYVLILGNFTNLPDVAKLSENYRYIFTPPKESHNWKEAMTGEVRGPFLALEFEKDMYNPDGWMIGSSDDTDRCVCRLLWLATSLALVGSTFESILTWNLHGRVLLNSPIGTHWPLLFTGSVETAKLLLTQKRSVKIETFAPSRSTSAPLASRHGV